MAEQPKRDWIGEAAKGLTRAQRKHVLAGGLHGDFTMATAQTLRDKGLFYLDIDSPNGQCGILRLTTYGRRVQERLAGSPQ